MREDGTGKWVRYDSTGHMVKGRNITEKGAYYFDPVYGTMAKGTVEIEGIVYQFDEKTGICQDKGMEPTEKPGTEPVMGVDHLVWKVTDMRYMFYGCENLGEILVGKAWQIRGEINTEQMFDRCGTSQVVFLDSIGGI